jgi:pimeloyl-ACP methyl ester carboxylesterase
MTTCPVRCHSLFAALVFILAMPSLASAEPTQPPPPRMVDLKAADGVILKASFFAASKPGPGVLLFHQSNRTRKAWDDVAGQLAAVGINTLTVDMRGFGESGGKDDKRARAGDIETAWRYLLSQQGITRDVIGVGGAGATGVENSVQAASRHTDQVKSLVLLSGETLQDGLQFLHQAWQLPELFVVADNDEYPPTVEAMELLYITASNPGKKFVHYSATQEAPWIWYEPVDVGRVPATGGHGTDLFQSHPDLPGIVVDWFVTTLIKTPGHAPADTLSCAAILNLIRMPGGIAQAARQLMQARAKDPSAQLWPEITLSIIGQDHMRAGEPKQAVEILKLDLVAYPHSADLNDTLADAYLKGGQKNLARQHAQRALAILDANGPVSSWTDTAQYRGEVRRDAEGILKKVGDLR